MLSFENTEAAFAGKSNKDLNRSFWLFKLVSNPVLVKAGAILAPAAFKLHLPIKEMVKHTIFKQFCGGENINECNSVIAELGKFNIGTILDYSVEAKESEKDFENTAQETINTIQKAKNNPHIPFSVFKVTGMARFSLLEKISSGATLNDHENNEFEKVKARINLLCNTAFSCDVPIFIDAEESWIQPAIDTIANQMMMKYNNKRAIVYNTFQLYRKDRLGFLKESFNDACNKNYFLGAKLVRGAYMEKERERALKLGYESPIHIDKQTTDKAFDEALLFCIENISRISTCAGTHNENSSLYGTELLKAKNINKNDPRIFFSQLLGMSDHISFNLAKSGYNVAKYVPYGPVNEVLPYLIRRAQENTSVKGQTGRELSLIIKEKKRRNQE